MELNSNPKIDEIDYFSHDLLPAIRQHDLGSEDLFLGAELARLAGLKPGDKEHRALVLLVLAARLTLNDGSTRLPLEPFSHLESLLGMFQAGEEEINAVKSLLALAKNRAHPVENRGLTNIFGSGGDYRPLVFDNSSLYLQKYHFLEARVGDILKNRLGLTPENNLSRTASDKPNDSFLPALEEVLSNPPHDQAGPLVLDTEQLNAVKAMLSGKITAISGRPGSGKTSIIASLLRVIARAESPPLHSIALAAPTGKAADRMRQAVAEHLAKIKNPGSADLKLTENCPPSTTLHRLLRYSPGQDLFWHNDNNPLPEKLVIVDESSMIDLVMMDHLLRALQPGTRLILLGDADQLPAVDAGSVFRDLCSAKSAHRLGRVKSLQKSYRASEKDSPGRAILNAAAAVNSGRMPGEEGAPGVPLPARMVEELLFDGVELLPTSDQAGRTALLEKWQTLLPQAQEELKGDLQHQYTLGPAGFDDLATERLLKLFSAYEKSRLLCVTRKEAGGTGSDKVNQWFHQRWGMEHQHEQSAMPGQFLPGEPVLVTRNDYALRLYNGDSGLVLKAANRTGPGNRPPELMAIFPRGSGFAAYPLASLQGKIELAWATTVHKAQGSEFDNVAIILPEHPVRPLTRELLYTAITRAKKSVVLVGSRGVLEEGIRQAKKRFSGLADLLEE